MKDSHFLVFLVCAAIFFGVVAYFENKENISYFKEAVPTEGTQQTSLEEKLKFLEEQKELFGGATTTSTTTSPTPPQEEVSALEPEEKKSAEKSIEQPEVAEPVTETPPPLDDKVVAVETSTLSSSEINTRAREALVNIFCLTNGPHAYITPISGSGTIIDERGVILTNAHIGQLYLFKDFPSEGFVDCLIRTGSPARAMYRAELLYISPAWIEENAEAIVTENPTGTGENDYAFLYITEAVQNQALPETFAHLTYDATPTLVTREEELLVAAYPAGLLGGSTIQKDLYASSAFIQAGELYTFSSTTLDVISLGGSVVAQQGSSGGVAVNSKGNVVGLITTSSDGETTGERDLRAITVEHIERSLYTREGYGIASLLAGDLKEKAAAFETTANSLLNILLKNF